MGDAAHPGLSLGHSFAGVIRRNRSGGGPSALAAGERPEAEREILPGAACTERPNRVCQEHQIDKLESTAYNLPMSSPVQPTPVTEERDSSRLIIVMTVIGFIAVMLAIAYLLRQPPQAAKVVPPYAASLTLSDFKMSAAENFIGATVTYFDGKITNAGDRTVTRVVVEVVFKDELGQVALRDEVPLRLLRETGPYTEPVDLSVMPLEPGQTRPFRLTFDHISAQWNRQFPAMRVTDLTVK